MWIWIIAAGLLTAFIVDWCYRQFAAARIRDLIDSVPPFGSTEEPMTESAELFSVVAGDGVLLTASLYLPQCDPSALILFSPELHGSQKTAAYYCAGLIADGFAVIAYNARGQGDSEGPPDFQPTQWATEVEFDDLLSVLDFVGSHDELSRLPLGAFGVSRGGSQVLLAACRTSRIKAVATDSAYDTMALMRQFIGKFSRYVVPDWFFDRLPAWHVNLVLRQALRKSELRRSRSTECRYLRLESEALQFSCPGLLISGSRDTYVSPATTHGLAEMLGCQKTDVWIVPKARHNKARQQAGMAYDARLVKFFRKSLLDEHLSRPDPPSDAAVTTTN